MSNDPISPWWTRGLSCVTLSRERVDALIHELEADTGRTVTDHDAFHRDLEEAVTRYCEAREEYDQRSRPAEVRDKYQQLLASFEDFRGRLSEIVSGVLLSQPLGLAVRPWIVAYDNNFSRAEMEKESLAEMENEYGPGASIYDVARGVEVECKHIDGLHVLFQEALKAASWEADQHPRRGRLSRGAISHLACDIAELYEAAVGLRAGVSQQEPDGGRFCRFVRSVWVEVEPDRPPPTPRSVARYLQNRHVYWSTGNDHINMLAKAKKTKSPSG